MSSGNCGDTHSPLILVVDDNQDSREICAMTLHRAGFRTVEAENGAMAVDRALALAPDVILLDHVMPVMDGPEAARRLRAEARTHQTPIVMLTGFDGASGGGEGGRASGDCDAYLAKPCDPERIIGALRAALLLSAVRFAHAGSRPNVGPDEITTIAAS
jgi:two-component system, cell cycle response regulator DivK